MADLNAILYLIICFCTGYVICTYAIPGLGEITEQTFRKKTINLCRNLVTLPAYFITGTIIVTWTTYIFANLFRNKKEPLLYANGVTLCIFLIISVIGIYINLKRNGISKIKKQEEVCSLMKTSDWIFLVLVIFLSVQLMWTTFFVSHNHLYVGISVFSDFSPHIGMIRSFSSGNNFPTMYSHYTGAGISYHFMFQFLVGNLEYLGMRLDLAMNIPSAIGMISSFTLLFVLAVKMSGKRVVGYLSCLFFAFRSSGSLFSFLAKVPKGTSIWKALSDNSEFLSTTTNESWGLWNLNVYCNQRHLAFTIPVLLLMVMLFLPSVYESMEGLLKGFAAITKEQKESVRKLVAQKVSYFIQYCFFTKESWRVKDWSKAIFAGVLIGALSFWNGAVTIAILLVLFVMAIVANRKLEYLITAFLAVCLSFIQTQVFIEGTAIKPKLDFGFIAENKTLWGTIDYILRLTGVLPLVLLLALLVVKRTRRYVMFAFLAPFVFAFTVSLTVDVTVNHKYIMLSLMLLSIYVAIVIVKMFEVKSVIMKAISIILVILLTSTGFYDYLTVLKKNTPQKAIVLDLDNKLTKWIMENTDAKDTILSSNYALNQVVLGGGMLFLGWPYFGWSAGYDTDLRAEQVKEMFEAQSSEELMQLVYENNIRYIIVDKECRDNEAYEVNEYNISNTFSSVYEDGTGEWKITIYDTNLPKVSGFMPAVE